jgi:4'-phosphopantetheinyl transferase
MSSALDRERPPLAGCLTAVPIRWDPRAPRPLRTPLSAPSGTALGLSPKTPPGPPPGSSVEAWRADLDALPGGLVELLGELLSPDEHLRAKRLAKEEDRRRWMRARGVLRALLGSYLESDPHELRLQIGKHGKPALAGSELNFNVSHSAGVAVYAFARGVPVGVDVELLHRRPAREDVALAERVFGAEVAGRLRALPSPARRGEFLREWVRHEATLKCLGVGLFASRPAEATAGLWVSELDVGPSAAAALAVQAQAA